MIGPRRNFPRFGPAFPTPNSIFYKKATKEPAFQRCRCSLHGENEQRRVIFKYSSAEIADAGENSVEHAAGIAVTERETLLQNALSAKFFAVAIVGFEQSVGEKNHAVRGAQLNFSAAKFRAFEDAQNAAAFAQFLMSAIGANH